ncbi:protein of unknown function DUF1904 [Paenibacillus curdlanolyticus YK9]|uniref:DUF1904 domain-containing protein n=1 Tax=Paenibacillus curdlanolyticus YK9 TaxID=717606 RepID=E0I6P8_9BACL|nr:DUF1904 family protein [Paenibacillus curdlanolyticus]EFM11714.1 protein of unknown function DUF1904 [Paenibacillus curdlanolyticus YK9]
MPHLLFRGIAAQQLRPLAQQLAEQLADICECGTDNFTMDCLHTTAVYGGAGDQSFPFVEVAWFERGDEVRGQVAAAVTQQLSSLGLTDIEVAFRTYREDSYYIDGVPCSAL